MKKIAILLTGTILAGTNVLQAQAFEKGTNALNIGVGLGGYVAYWGVGYKSTPYLNLSFEHGVYDFPKTKNLSIGIGGYLGYKSVSYEWNSSWVDKNGKYHFNEPIKYTWTYTHIGIRPTLHYSFNDKAEIYGGLNIGYVVVSFKYSPSDFTGFSGSYGSTIGWGTFVGGRYYFSKSFGIYAELGYGAAYLNLGVSLKF